ncbi:MAG: response regulator [Firmicutes bacterium]|nr:response regulator [Bacillota bacterium]
MENKLKNFKKISVVVIILIFCILSYAVFSVSQKISREMSDSAINNLSESLQLIKDTVEVLYKKEAEFQKILADELSVMENPDNFILSYNKNSSMVKLSIIEAGATEGISNTGEIFSEESLDFSDGNTISDLPISSAYLNSMGTWAYTMKCPVIRNGQKIADFYAEYIYDSFDEALPDKFYNNNATLYIMDSKSQRFVLKPKGLSERISGNINLNDFYESNNILEKNIQDEISRCITSGDNIMFYHDVRNQKSLIYMWAINSGSSYLIGYVPIEAIQQEGKTVNQNMFIVMAVMLIAFIICCIVYFLNTYQLNKSRNKREKEKELHNKQLAEALQMAQAASNSKTTFLSNMSHDIRTPMNAILGFTTLLEKEAGNAAKVREYTKKISASGQHLLSLINDVLDVSKIESGKTVLTIGEFTLSNMVSSVDTIIRPTAKAKGQTFDVSVTGVHHEYLMGDETRINQILINLLSNAVKYTPEGGHIWLRIIGLKQHTNQYEHIRIEVEDDGYGMTPEYLEIIFDAFTRAENSTTNKVQGTGLGMAITKNIVELMGGTIDVVSEIDKGSLFTVDLELRISEHENQTNKKFWTDHGISRILAIDDEEYICTDIKTIMGNIGIYVDTALSGEAAIKLASDMSVHNDFHDVILLDLNMPDMNGIETAGHLREIIPDEIPIIILTASDWEGLEDKASYAGIDGFIAKPFFISAFKEKLSEIYSEHNEHHYIHKVSDDYHLNGLHFLMAEDNDINAEILWELLDIEGATCEISVNGEKTLERFKNSKENEFDAILMDVQMPVMNGYEATKAIRALDRKDAKTIPIIAMTANAFAEDVKEAMNAGMNAHVAKPVNMELLKKTIRQILKERS